MEYCRQNNRPQQAYLIRKHAVTIRQPAGIIPSGSWIYDYGILECFSLAAYNCGQYGDCLEASNKLLAEGKIAETARARLSDNARVAAKMLGNSSP
jgi:hypothetical protein